MAGVLEIRNEYRLEEWAQMIRRCRESGLSNREFCRQNGISEKTFYYRLRKLREAAVRTESDSNVTLFRVEPHPDDAMHINMLHIRYHGADIEITGDTSPDALRVLLKAMSGI